MLLTSSDNQAARDVTYFYCIFTCTLMPIVLGILHFTEFYLKAGQSNFLPIIAMLAVFELMKWWFCKYFYEKDIKIVNSRRTYTLFRNIDVWESIKCLFVVVIGCFAYFIIAILFGAEIFENHEETLMFGVLMAVLTIFPMCLHLGRMAIKAFLFGQKPTNTFHWLLHWNFRMTLLGAWSGAVVIPLDWDRPWQVWPIPCSFAALLGFTCSHYLVLFKYFIMAHYKMYKKQR